MMIAKANNFNKNKHTIRTKKEVHVIFKLPGYCKHFMTRWRCDSDDAINIVAVGESSAGLYPHAGGESG